MEFNFRCYYFSLLLDSHYYCSVVLKLQWYFWFEYWYFKYPFWNYIVDLFRYTFWNNFIISSLNVQNSKKYLIKNFTNLNKYIVPCICIHALKYNNISLILSLLTFCLQFITKFIQHKCSCMKQAFHILSNPWRNKKPYFICLSIDKCIR